MKRRIFVSMRTGTGQKSDCDACALEDTDRTVDWSRLGGYPVPGWGICVVYHCSRFLGSEWVLRGLLGNNPPFPFPRGPDGSGYAGTGHVGTLCCGFVTASGRTSRVGGVGWSQSANISAPWWDFRCYRQCCIVTPAEQARCFSRARKSAKSHRDPMK